MQTLSLISLLSNLILGLTIVYMVFKNKIHTSIHKIKEHRRDTERQKIRQVVEEVLREIIKDDF